MSFFGNLFNRSPSPPPRASSGCQSVTENRDWYKLLLIVLVGMYWGFAVFFERMFQSAALTQDETIVNPLAFMLRGMFTLQSARHLIPIVVGWWLANETAVAVIQHLYDLPDTSGARHFLGQLQSGTSGRNATAEPINPQTLHANRFESVLLRIGGPGKIKLPATYVGVTEMNNRFCRVLSPGKSNLNAFEYIHTILDLRQQDRFLPNVSLASLDGIPFRASINIVFRIKPGSHPTEQKPYPYDEEAVRQVAYLETVSNQEGNVRNWEDLTGLRASGVLQSIARKYTLDQMFFPGEQGEVLYEPIQNEFRRTVYRAFSSMGLELLEVRIVNIELPDPVKDRYVAYWQSQSDAELNIKKARNKVAQLEKIESARADAEETMINAILEGVHKARQSGGTSRITEIVALRLVEAMERMAISSEESQMHLEKYLPAIEQSRHELYELQTDSEDTAES